MITRRIALAALASAPLASVASAQASWPSRPITFTIPFQAGARIVVENRAGAGGTIGSEYVRRQPADGYALLLATPSTHGTVPALQPDTTPYNPISDFTPIAIMGRAPIALAVPKDSPHRDAASLIAAVRAEPGKASWGSSGSGSVGHLAGELMALLAGGLQAEHIPYRGGAGVAEALTKGEVQYAWEPLGSLTAGARDGLFRIIAVGTSTRHPLLPEVATMQEAGLPGFEATTWNVMVGPLGMPSEIVNRLSAAANASLAEPDVRERLAAAGIDAVSDSTPQSTAAFLAAEYAKYRDIVGRANLRTPR